MYDMLYSDPRFVKKKLYSFYSDVLSDIDSDSMTKKEITLELDRRQLGKAIKGSSIILIYKKL
jgi:hypothetical protein